MKDRIIRLMIALMIILHSTIVHIVFFFPEIIYSDYKVTMSCINKSIMNNMVKAHKYFTTLCKFDYN